MTCSINAKTLLRILCIGLYNLGTFPGLELINRKVCLFLVFIQKHAPLSIASPNCEERDKL